MTNPFVVILTEPATEISGGAGGGANGDDAKQTVAPLPDGKQAPFSRQTVPWKIGACPGIWRVPSTHRPSKQTFPLHSPSS